jgi:hypothetical protein
MRFNRACGKKKKDADNDEHRGISTDWFKNQPPLGFKDCGLCVRCFKQIWKVGKVGKVGEVGKVGKVGKVGREGR